MEGRRSRGFADEQIISILREQEFGAKTADVCRTRRISSVTYSTCKAKFDGLDVSEAPASECLSGDILNASSDL